MDGSGAVLCGAMGLLPSLWGNFLQLRWALLGPAGTLHGVKLEPSAAPHALAHLYTLSHHAHVTIIFLLCSFIFVYFPFYYHQP